MRNSGCLVAAGLGLGLALGGGFIYLLATSYEMRLILLATALITLGIVLGTVGLWVNNRQWTRALNLQLGPGATTYRVDARPQVPYYQPGPSMYPQPLAGWNQQLVAGPPPLPEMPPMPDYDQAEDDVDAVV